LAAGSNKQQQRGGRKHGIADRKVSAAHERVDVGEAERAQIPDKRERAKNESGIADTVHDERLVGSGRSGVTMEVKTDQKIRAQAHAFPSHEQNHVVIRQDERKHRKHEQVHVSEEPVVTAFVRHVSGGVNVDQHAHAGHEEQPDSREGIKREPGAGVDEASVPSRLTKFKCPSPLPSHVYTIFSKGRPEPCAKFVYSKTVKQAKRNASTTTPTQTALTVAFCSRRPKKNIIAAPKAGKSGISQMWSRKNMSLVVRYRCSLFVVRC